MTEEKTVVVVAQVSEVIKMNIEQKEPFRAFIQRIREKYQKLLGSRKVLIFVVN